MTSYNVWSVSCTTEGAVWKTWILPESASAPTTCPTNTSHTINTTLTYISARIDPNVVKILEENIATGENYMVETKLVSCPTGPNVTTTYDFTWPIPINVLTLMTKTKSDNLLDNVSCCAGPNTIIGVLAASAVTGASILTVSSTVIQYTMVGYYLNLLDNSGTVDCGRVLSKNTNLNTVTIETPLSRSYSVFSPTYVRQTVYVVNDFTFGHAGSYNLGNSKIGGSYVPANTIVRVTYTNNGNTAKVISVLVEYLY